MKPIKDLLVAKDVPVDDPNDATLSGSEHAQAIIVAALVEQWDRLDGYQQRSIVNALDASTAATEEAEKWVRDRLRPAE
ncbi:antitoxin [Corynebacterium sp. YIM 101645]|uniref:Antitoxin n=1 Tax=Corynebacterium lemuris TaxID=1859292 RepID=A0ABT2G0C0_9CORY|nr:antitoxin [Corynebacterium lemuris]MCS5480951.1 antitoxin [Corynebacterium lemuris]